jgi:hypothetical protein
MEDTSTSRGRAIRQGVAAALAGVLVAGSSWAAGADHRAEPASLTTTRPAPKAPLLRGGLDPRVVRRLRLAHELAVERVQSVPSCRALFERLGTDGTVYLARTLYFPASDSQRAGACGRGAIALTVRGNPQTRLCPVFESLRTEWAAVAVIHEALHFAGLGERPVDPNGMSSMEINRMVEASCGL